MNPQLLAYLLRQRGLLDEQQGGLLDYQQPNDNELSAQMLAEWKNPFVRQPVFIPTNGAPTTSGVRG